MRVAVLSWNILHSHGAARLQRSARAPGTWAIDRYQRVSEHIRRQKPDVVCLQEVDAVALDELQRSLDGYELAAELRNETLPPKDGCATFIRSNRFEILDVLKFRMRDHLPKFLPQLDGSGLGMAAALRRELHEKLNATIALRLRCRLGSESDVAAEVCVATTHLFWNPKYPDLKLLQAFLVASELEHFADTVPLILAGDLNSTPQMECGNESGVYELLTRGSIGAGHPHHPVALRKQSGILSGVTTEQVPRLEVRPFRSGYLDAFSVDGPITNASRDFTGCLDYILYRDGRDSIDTGIELLSAVALPSVETLRSQLPLPSLEHPSDHLPLQAEFLINRSFAAS